MPFYWDHWEGAVEVDNTSKDPRLELGLGIKPPCPNCGSKKTTHHQIIGHWQWFCTNCGLHGLTAYEWGIGDDMSEFITYNNEVTWNDMLISRGEEPISKEEGEKKNIANWEFFRKQEKAMKGI